MTQESQACGYWIVHITVADADNYPQYLAANKIPFEKFGAEFLVRGGQFELIEGTSRERHVVVRFETYEKALACYHSPEYQKAAKLRQAFAETDLVIVKGCE
jgi:uncharacterized protein (DUF1330 family)